MNACPHCLNQPGGCIHCREARIAARELRGPVTSQLTNADREKLGIFLKPWRGVAAGTSCFASQHRPERPERRGQIPPRRMFNSVLPLSFAL